MTTDHKNDLTLLTGARGRQCGHLLPHLIPKLERLRLVIKSESSADNLRKQYHQAEVLQADLADLNECRRVMKGVTAVYHVGPTFDPQEQVIGYNMIEAAVTEFQNGSFKHFVLSSVLDTQIQKMMNHDVKRYIEERLLESGLNYTILQPSIFMDSFPIPLLMSQENPVYEANWNLHIPFSFLALRDFGEVSAIVLEQREKHYLAQYQLVSSDQISYKQAVEIVSKEIGKEIMIKERSYAEAVKFYLNMLFGGGPYHSITRDTTQRMLLYYNNHGLRGNKDVLEWLLGRKATSYSELTKLRVANEREGKI